MPNLYQITKQLHETVQEKAKKHNLELEIESDKYYGNHKITENIQLVSSDLAYHLAIDNNFDHIFGVIQADQIRQILVAFKDVLIDDKIKKNAEWFKDIKETDICPYCGFRIIQNQAEDLCDRWLDGLNPLFDREPEKVLTELNKILSEL
jgi:hypothetical protein